MYLHTYLPTKSYKPYIFLHTNLQERRTGRTHTNISAHLHTYEILQALDIARYKPTTKHPTLHTPTYKPTSCNTIVHLHDV